MKTAISLPNELFERAEATAKSMRLSRSELYARAISDYLKTHEEAEIPRKLNEFYIVTPAKIDEGFRRVAMKRLRESEW